MLHLTINKYVCFGDYIGMFSDTRLPSPRGRAGVSYFTTGHQANMSMNSLRRDPCNTPQLTGDLRLSHSLTLFTVGHSQSLAQPSQQASCYARRLWKSLQGFTAQWFLSKTTADQGNVNPSGLWKIAANPDIKVRGAHMGPTWGHHGPGGPHVGPMNLAIWEDFMEGSI